MDKLKVFGKANLKGSIKIPGAKNSVLPIMASSILSSSELRLKNVPFLVDMKTMKKLLESFGTKFSHQGDSMTLINKNLTYQIADYDLVRKMRASILVLGPLLSRFGKAKISLPGGCAIGTRPIDLHLFGLEKMGVQFKIKEGYIIGKVKGKLKGSKIKFPDISVGATENIIMAAVLAEGETKIINAAKEPEIIDLARCLNKMGAKIIGAGKSNIKIIGVSKLNKASHTIIPDRIVAGTYIISAIMLNKNFLIKNIITDHLNIIIKTLIKMGANLEVKKNYVKIKPSRPINGIKIETGPYPNFPTDLQAQMMCLMTIINGKSQIKENIFENRFLHVPELNRLGADIKIKDDTAYIIGNKKFKGTNVMASDLRASISLVLAGLSGEGITTVNRVYHLDRGYENIELTLGKCGPKIIRVK